MSRAGLYLKQWQDRCVLCQSRPIATGFLCDECDTSLVWGVPFAIDVKHERLDGFASSHYYGPMAQALEQFKDHENLRTLPFLVHALAKIADQLADTEAVILAIPTTDERLASRGFYPVGELGAYLSALTGYPLYKGLIRRSDGKHQRGLSRGERLENVEGAFLLVEPPPTQTVIVFDDVATTGATIKSVITTLYDYDERLHIKPCCLAHGKPDG